MTSLPTQVEDANYRHYSSTSLGTWSSVSDVDAFFSRFNHDNGYKDGDTELSVGNYVYIKSGTSMYNTQWVIAGFDLEHNQTAADGTVYDNGYGICMIPQTRFRSTNRWNNTATLDGAYMSSYMHTTILPGIVDSNGIGRTLGTHVVNRNVLLSSSVKFYISNEYTWTTARATLMSAGQIKTCSLESYNNKYDDGEANYFLPLFYYINCAIDSNFWLRGISGGGGSSVYCCQSDGTIGVDDVYNSRGIRPMIYLR